MKSIFRLLLCLLLITAAISVPRLSYAQCALTGFTEPGVPANITPPCGTFSSQNVGPGTQTSFQVLNGGSYTFSTCNSSFNTQITGRSSTAQLFFNDDNGPICATNRASATWTATYSGTAFVVVTTPGCGLGSTSSGVSAILDYRQNNNLSFTSASTAMCPGQTRTLSATPAGGTFTGTGVSGTTLTAPSASSVVITYTFGSCSTQQTININTPQAAPTGATSNPTSVCSGVQSVLTANGGALGTGGSYQWYAGGCGAGSVLGTTSSITVTPTTTTTYFVRITGACGTTACVSTTVNVSTASTNPTGIATTNNNFCQGGSATLTVQGGSLGSGATWRWYSGTCCAGPQIGTGNSITVSPVSTTTYYVRAEGGSCGTTNEASLTINVNTSSTAPTGIASTNGTTFCSGLGTTTLNVQGGSLGTGATWNWYTGTCGGTFIGTGPSINVNPTSNTTYFVRAEGTCPPPTGCASVTINVSTPLSITIISKTDVTCNGSADGTATVNFTGGQPNYAFTWSSGTGGATRNNLSAGNYDVTVTDAIGCSATASVTINQPPLLQITNVASTNITCNGSNDGTITVTAIGGSGTLTYTIGGLPQQSNVFNNLPPGVYNVQVIDTNLCQANFGTPVTISQPTPVVLSLNGQTDASCSGVNNGTIQTSATGGNPPYTFSINNSPLSPSGNFNNLAAGNYEIIVRDASGCQDTVSTSLSNTTSVTLNVDTAFDVSCAGAADGGFTVSLSNGVQPYTYSINGITFVASGTFSGLSGGTYTVLGRDASGCQDIVQITITEAAPLVVTVDSVAQIGCSGSSVGGVFISVSGGTAGNVPTYSALTNNTYNGSGLLDGTFSSLSSGALTGRPDETGSCCSVQDPPVDIFEFTVDASGSYTITSNYNGGFNGYLLLYTDPLDWTQNPPATFVVGDDDCTAFFNSCVTANLNAGQTYYLVTTRQTGTGTSQTWNSVFSGPGQVLQVTGSTLGYNYQWSNGPITQDNDSIPAGTYTVTVTDDNGCTATATATINQPLPLTLSLANLAEVRCNGGTDGEIDVTVTGGTPPYNFVWSNGTLTEDNTNLTAGTYDVTLTDGNGCTQTASYTITEPTAIVVTGVVTDAACGTSPNGAVDVTVAGGTPPYTYFWTSGQATQDITGLAPGIYTVQVLDSRNCLSSASFTVGGGSSLAIAIDTVINVSCFGDSTGAIDIVVTGGATPLTYAWSNGESTQNIANLPAGTYTVTVTDANGCQDALSATVTQPSAFVATAAATNVSCNGANDGEVDLTVSGGAGGYSYVWSNSATTQDLTGLAGGTYTVTVTDANGCTIALAVNVTEPTPLNIQGTVSNVSCSGGNNGVVNVSVSGGVPSYTYVWNNGGTSSSLFGLTAGAYTVTVTDANGCTASQAFTVTEPTAVAANVTGTNVSCFGGANGTTTASATGGTAPYTYLWSGSFATGASQTGLTAGTYTVLVTDANGCTATGSYTVTQPTQVVVTETVDNVSCNGGTDGAISISINGGTGPYNVNWSNGSFTNGTTTSSITNLTAGSYSVTVSDANGCSLVASYTVTEPTAIALATTVTNAGCNGVAGGAIDLSVSGGTPNYTYNWNPGGANTQDLSGVAAGTYDVTVTDANGCTATTSATVSQPAALTLQASINDVSCNGQFDGDVFLTVTGGSGSFNYQWSNSSGSQNLINVAAGTYDVTVTDGNGCTATGSYTVSEPTVLASTMSVTDVACFGQSTGAADLSVTGGTAPYTYLWSGSFSVSEDLANIPAGTYVVVITDANGCSIVDTAVVNQNPELAVTETVTNVTCFGANDGSILVNVSGGVAPYSYAWSGSANTTNFEQGLAPGTYTVTVTDDEGCTLEATYTITGPTQLVGTGVVTNITCNGAANGSIDLTVSGGVGPYSFLWSNNDVTEDLSGLAASDYDVIVTDANGCVFRDTFTIAEPAAIVSSIVGSDASCAAGTNGTAILSVSGGTAPYTFFWSNFRFTQNIYNLSAGQYFVIITDANGCETVDSVTIGEPVVLEVTGSAKGAGCGNEARGSVDITVTGGTAPYDYLWSTGDVSEDITGLGTGTYCVTVTDANGCQAFFCAVVTSFPLPTAQFTSSLACDDQEVTFTNLSNISSGSLSYIWDFGDGSATTTDQDPIHIFTAPGTYPVTLIALSGEGCTDTIVTNVVVNPTPDATITANGVTGSVCAGDSVVLSAPSGSGYTYLWNTNDTTQSITALTSGVYGVTITSGALCSGIGEIEVGIFSEAAVTISPDTTISLGYSTTLVATGGIAYEWSPSQSLNNAFTGSPVATPSVNTTYSVTVTVSDGCVTTREVTVTLVEDFRLDLPNLFTPNGDGINDTWVIKNIFTYNAEVLVFNRWGTEVYSTTNYQNDWAGTNGDGDELSDGTYYYVVKVGDRVYKGAVTILR